jgi:hypothetical protein
LELDTRPIAQRRPSTSTAAPVFLQPPSTSTWTSSQAYACASFYVTSKATSIYWNGYGLKIQVLDDSIPHDITAATLDVSVHYINSPSCLPVQHDHHDYLPVSALYSIKVGRPDRRGRLCKSVTIEIQHCGSNLAPEQLTLLRASSEREYFEPVADTVFDQTTNYGRVIVPKLVEGQEYNDFSWFIIAIRQLFFPSTIYYKAQVFISKTAMMMHFIVTVALDIYSTVSCLLLVVTVSNLEVLRAL